MNDLDALMQAAWQQEQPPADFTPAISARVRRHRWRHRLLRGVEVALTLALVPALAVPLLSRTGTGPSDWLVLPFFLVYVPVAWSLLLREPRIRAFDAARDGRSYARVRASQLHRNLRELWLARRAAQALLAYAVIVTACVLVLARTDPAWVTPALTLLAMAIAWAAATFWLSRRQRRRWLREYRAMRQLADVRRLSCS